MTIVGVVDLAAGRAVHARGGRREIYRPVASVAGSAIDAGDAPALARAYAGLGVNALYVADLDAILGRTPHEALVVDLVGTGLPLWLDAGLTSAEQARRALDLGVSRVVAGLETLTSWDALAEICRAVDRTRVAFSLDLRHGKPIVAPGGPAAEPGPIMAARAAEAGATTIIVLDLARIGTSAGLDEGLVARVRGAVPAAALVAGGGVRGLDDLTQLAAAGCDGALVASAVLEGRLGASDIAAAQRFTPSVARPSC